MANNNMVSGVKRSRELFELQADHKIGHIPTDHALISALVERLCPETRTFHFQVGEMTIPVQDIAVLLGLRVDGQALCLPTNRNWPKVAEDLLGKEVDET